jgi:hypothetical protein
MVKRAIANAKIDDLGAIKIFQIASWENYSREHSFPVGSTETLW